MLVIIGLLVGGVLVGRDLIKAAKLRAVITEKEKFETAVNTFRGKYNCLPGDCANATLFWGEVDSTPSTCLITQGTGTQTCNGNGDKIILSSTGSNESFRFWQHLANAGLIDGDYTGIKSNTSGTSASEANSPKSKSGGLWFAYNWGSRSGDTKHGDGYYGNSWELGASRTNGDPAAALFTPLDLWTIDSKIDDGKPIAGKVVHRNILGNVWTDCTDATNSADTSADYAITTDVVGCVAIFRDLF